MQLADSATSTRKESPPLVGGELGNDNDICKSILDIQGHFQLVDDYQLRVVTLLGFVQVWFSFTH